MIGNKIPPFRFWCQKVLPTVYDDSLSYYEVLNRVTQFLNDVITQMNTLTESEEAFQQNMNDAWENYSSSLTNEWNTYRTELTAVWEQYKNYIDTYFDNLDVQEEINNKLDEMASDGTLDALLLPYFNTYKNEINAIIEIQNNNIESQGSQIDVLEERMDTFTHLTDGSTSGDAELADIRVGANGVTYNSAGDAVRGQITDLTNLTKNSYTNIELTFTNYGIDSTTGQTSANNARLLSNQFIVGKGQKLTVTAKSGYQALVLYYNCDGTYVGPVDRVNTAIVETTATLTMPNDGLVVINVLKRSGANITPTEGVANITCVLNINELVNGINDKNKGVNVVELTYENKGINISTGEISSNAKRLLSLPVRVVKGQIVTFRVEVTFSAVICFFNVNGEYLTYDGPYVGAQTITFTADNDYLLRFNVLYTSLTNDIPTGAGKAYTFLTVNGLPIPYIKDVESMIANSADYESKDYLHKYFTNVLCYGDSLTEGYYGSGVGVKPETYPFYFTKITGAETLNKGIGGLSASVAWQVLNNEIPAYLNWIPTDGNFDAIILFLGTNLGLTDTVDTDAPGTDYHNYDTSTNTGGYCAVVARLMELYPNAKMFLVNLPYSSQKTVSFTENTNDVIDKIGAKFNVPVLNLMEKSPFTTTNNAIYCPVDGLHYGRLGYNVLGGCIANLIKDEIANNLIDYK